MRSGTQSSRVLKISWVCHAAKLPNRMWQATKSFTLITSAQLSSYRLPGGRHCFRYVHACSLYFIVSGELACSNSQRSFLYQL